MLTYNNQYYVNIILLVVACVVLGLSIWAFVTRCTDKFGSLKSCPSSTSSLDDSNTYKRRGWCNEVKDNKLKKMNIAIAISLLV